MELFTDASHQGWGGHLGSLMASGSWSPEWWIKHINLLELQAVRLCLESFLPSLVGRTVKLATDNSTVACYVNKQGGGGGGGARSRPLSLMAEDLLLWCPANILLFARHIVGKLNIVADLLSRPHMVLNTEWTQSHKVLRRV